MRGASKPSSPGAHADGQEGQDTQEAEDGEAQGHEDGLNEGLAADDGWSVSGAGACRYDAGGSSVSPFASCCAR